MEFVGYMEHYVDLHTYISDKIYKLNDKILLEENIFDQIKKFSKGLGDIKKISSGIIKTVLKIWDRIKKFVINTVNVVKEQKRIEDISKKLKEVKDLYKNKLINIMGKGKADNLKKILNSKKYDEAKYNEIQDVLNDNFKLINENGELNLKTVEEILDYKKYIVVKEIYDDYNTFVQNLFKVIENNIENKKETNLKEISNYSLKFKEIESIFDSIDKKNVFGLLLSSKLNNIFTLMQNFKTTMNINSKESEDYTVEKMTKILEKFKTIAEKEEDKIYMSIITSLRNNIDNIKNYSHLVIDYDKLLDIVEMSLDAAKANIESK